MKIIGISVRFAMRSCNSRPSKSGSVTSSIRQLGVSTRGHARNSPADAKVLGCQPATRIIDSSDSRTETSSSTTNTIGVSRATGVPECLTVSILMFMAFILRASLTALGPVFCLNRNRNGLEQSRLGERLLEASNGTLREDLRPKRAIILSSDENGRDPLSAPRQFRHQLESRHTRQADIDNETAGLTGMVGREELLRRRECLGFKAQLPHQVGQ